MIAAVRQEVASVSLRRQRFRPRRAGDGDGRVDRLVVRRRDRAYGHGVGIQRRERDALRVRRLVAGHGKRVRRVLIAERLDAVAVLAVRLRQTVGAPTGDLRGLPVHHQHRALVRGNLKFYGVELDIQADVDGLPAVGDGERARRVVVLVRRDRVGIVAVRQLVGVPAHRVDLLAVLRHGQRRVLRREGKRDGIFRRRVLPAEDGVAALCIRRIAAAEQTGHFGCFQLGLGLCDKLRRIRRRPVAGQFALRQVIAVFQGNKSFCCYARGTFPRTAADHTADGNTACCVAIFIRDRTSVIAIREHDARVSGRARITDNAADTLCVAVAEGRRRRSTNDIAQIVAVCDLGILRTKAANDATQRINARDCAGIETGFHRAAEAANNAARAFDRTVDHAGVAAALHRRIAGQRTCNAASAIINAFRFPSIYNIATIQAVFNCHAAARCNNTANIVAVTLNCTFIFAVCQRTAAGHTGYNARNVALFDTCHVHLICAVFHRDR